MPNRILKESIHTSETVNKMTDFQFRLWVNLITYVDDYGRGDARPAIIKGTCFPLRDRITNKDVEATLSKLADIGCVGLYEVDGKPYLYFPNWESHQRVRQRVSKCPAPDKSNGLQQVAASCGELRRVAASCGNMRPESESESEYRIQNTNTESEETSYDVCATRCDTHRSAPESEPTKSDYNLILNDGTEYNVPLENIEAYKKYYPGVDVEQELRNMAGWCFGNPANRKTQSGVKRFISGWLAREQNRGKAAKPTQGKKLNGLQYEQRTYTQDEMNSFYTDLNKFENG